MGKYNIYCRKDGRYEGRLTRGRHHNGKRRFQYFFGHSRKEVEEKIDFCRNSEQTETCSKTIGELFAEWYQSIQHRVKESTAANYRMKAEKHVLPAFSTVPVSKMSASAIYAFVSEKQSCGLSNRYISDIIIMMKTFFKYAARTYHFLNPMEGITLPKLQKTEIELLDEQQQVDLQQYITENPNHTTLGVALSMSMGIRIGELCALQWEDINLEKRILTIRKTIQRIQTPDGMTKTKLIIAEPKSESSKRKIPIPECVFSILKQFKGKRDDYVISDSEKPIEPRTMQYRFASILKNAKLPSIHFHALRHMFASNCVKLGFDIKTLSEILGHSKVEITLNKYVHTSFEQKQRYMSLVSLNF